MITGGSLWYLSRATGVTTLVLLTLVVLGGILVRGGATVARLPRFVVLGLHRNVALLSVAFLSLHVASVVIDPYVTINLVDALVPFVSSYRTVWLGLGAVALDLILAIVVTSLLRVRLGLRAWRAVHWLTYAAWPVALVHGLFIGSDVGQRWMQAIAVLCAGSVAAAVVWRVSLGSARPDGASAIGGAPAPAARSRVAPAGR